MQSSKQLESIIYAGVAVISLMLTVIGGMVIGVYQTSQKKPSTPTAVALVASVHATVTPTPNVVGNVLANSTHTLTPTIRPSSTHLPVVAQRASDTPIPPTHIPLTSTFTMTPSTIPPTATATLKPTLPTQTFTPTHVPPTSTTTVATATPGPVVSTGESDIFNVLLLGSDQRPDDPGYRTDTIIVVSINRTAGTVAFLSIPRDLWVSVPGFGPERINVAAAVGDAQNGPGKGASLLADTITNNLGVKIDRYAKVNFSGFKEIVDTLDGIDVPVDCPLTDYKLADPSLDPTVVANFKLYTLPIGIHHMDGATALWYARSRETSSDFDRSRRQQLVLRAMWHKVLDRHMLNDLPGLWGQVTKVVDTNLTLADVAGLLPLAAGLNSAHVHSYFLGPGQVSNWVSPAGEEVLLPQPGPIRDLVKQVYTPPTSNQLVAEQSSVDVYNGTLHDDWDKVAVSRLTWEGFNPTDGGAADTANYPRTIIYDFTGNAKPASLKTLQTVLGVQANDVIPAPDPNRSVDFRIVLGASYNACTYSAWQSAN